MLYDRCRSVVADDGRFGMVTLLDDISLLRVLLGDSFRVARWLEVYERAL